MKDAGLTVIKGLASIVLFLISLQSFAQETIDLPQAINYALTQNRELARSALGVDFSAFEVTKANAEFRLKISPEVSIGFSDGQELSSYGVRATKKLAWGTELSIGSHLLKEQGDYASINRGSIQVEIQQPVFRSFGSLIHKEALIQANNDLKTAQRSLEMQKADLIVEAVQTYEKILQLERQVQSDQESFQRMDKLYRITKAKEILGRTTRIDTLRVELLRGQALFRLEATQERLSSGQRDFAELLGFSPDKVFKLKPTPLLEYKVPQPEEAIQIALRNRLDYAQILQDYMDANRGVRVAQKRLLPDLKLIARKEWFGDAESLQDFSLMKESIWFVGISFDMDFDLKRERAALDQASNYQNSAFQTIEIVELSIVRQVHQQILAYRRAQAELKIAERNFNLAAARAKLAQRLFELGRSDNFSVTDAEESYLQAENQLLSAQAEASLAGYWLSHVLGTLVEPSEQLKPKPIQKDQ
jgi:outer membrane protein TolC